MSNYDREIRDKIHRNYCNRMHSLYSFKNADYGNSVGDTFEKFGIDSFLVRMYDKMNRLYTLSRPGMVQKVQDEKIEDTLLDLANYAIIALVELEMKKSKEKEYYENEEEEDYYE